MRSAPASTDERDDTMHAYARAPQTEQPMARQGRACGKVILFGEHAVVYGYPAIAAAIPQGATAWCAQVPRGPSRVRVPEWGVDASEDSGGALGTALAALLHASGVRTPVRVEVQTSLCAGEGLGSSAALGVAIARSLDGAAKADAIVARAMEWERVFHGTPSGIDVHAAASAGGCLRFVRGVGARPLRTARRLFLCIGRTGEGKSTRVMVESVAALRATRRLSTDVSLERLGEIAEAAAGALASGLPRAVGVLMTRSHAILRDLELSTPALDELCTIALASGALGAKLTGGGGGGCAIALASSARGADAIVAAWREAGFDGFAAGVGPGGGVAHVP
jgi:mevalonate kinase